MFKRILFLLPALLPFLSRAGNITGKITDAGSGETVIGATVTVVGTTSGGVTDVDGRFTIQVDSGTYTVQVTYMGYETKEITDVAVTPTAPAVLTIVLNKAVKNQALTGVVVRSTYKKENISSLYLTQKNSASISDGISADVIKRSPDRSTGEVLKRVSGTTVQDNKFIVVRGLNERYNTSMLNNAALPSTQPDRKAFSFDLIPSNLVDNVTIYKTATPDLPGDFSGGAVRVSTKDFPEKAITEIGLGTNINTNSTGKDYYVGAHGGSLDFLGFLDNSRKLPASFPGTAQYLKLPVDQMAEITKQFPDNFGYKKTAALPGLNLQFTNGNTVKVGKNKLGYIFSAGYRSAQRHSDGDRDEYDIAKVQLYHYHNDFYTTSNNLGAIMNVAYTYGKSKISLKNFFNNDFNSRITLRNGANYERAANQPLNIESYSEEVEQNGLFNSVLEGTHALTGKSKLDWNLSYGRAYRNQPDQKILSFVQDMFDGTDNHPWYIKLSNVNSPAIKDAGRVYSNLGENIFGAGANYTLDYKLGSSNAKFKAGVLGNYRSRDAAVTALGYSSTLFGGQTIQVPEGGDYTTTFSHANLNAYNPPVILANIPTNSIDYTGTAALGAAYLSSENNITGKLKAVWGARIEYYRQVLTLSGNDNIKTNTDVLPSVNLAYALTDKSNLRLSGFEAVNRPEFREFAPYRYYDYDNDFIISGNPDLKRSTSTNIDLRYELYPHAGEILSGSLFFKNFQNPIEQVNQGNNVLTYMNTTNAKVYGAEIEVRKSLGFIYNTAFLNNLSIYINAAYIKGQVDIPGKTGSGTLLQGQSPYILNTGLNYTTKESGLAFSLLYNRIGERIRYRGVSVFDIWEKSRNVIDFQVGKQFLKNKAEIKLTISDLLAQPYSYYYKYGTGTAYKPSIDKIISSINYGRTIALTLRYTL